MSGQSLSKAERIEQVLRIMGDRYAIPDTPEAGILAFLAKKIYGVRRWSSGEYDARIFVINAVLNDKYLNPTREQFVKITGDGDLYDIIVAPPGDDPNSQHRVRVMQEMKVPSLQPICEACEVPMERSYAEGKVVGYQCVICFATKAKSKDD